MLYESVTCIVSRNEALELVGLQVYVLFIVIYL